MKAVSDEVFVHIVSFWNLAIKESELQGWKGTVFVQLEKLIAQSVFAPKK